MLLLTAVARSVNLTVVLSANEGIHSRPPRELDSVSLRTNAATVARPLRWLLLLPGRLLRGRLRTLRVEQICFVHRE